MNNVIRFCSILVLIAIVTGCGGGEQEPVNVTLETSRGDIVLELYPAQAPVTVENFLTYAREGFYDGTLFHRVIPRFMIQGGGFDENLRRKETHDPIKNESSDALPNDRGTISMARTNELNSATSQFFINVVNNTNLNELKYAVFGKVIEGMDVVDEIAVLETQNTGASFANLPVDPVVIKSVKIDE